MVPCTDEIADGLPEKALPGSGRQLHALGLQSPPVFQIPAGLRSLLLNQAMPSGVARIFAARSSSQSATLSGVNFTTLMRTAAGQQGQGSSVQANPMAAALQEAIDAAQLGVVGNALNLVSAITYTVSGALSTVASALGTLGLSLVA